jgi:hypothetical protein
MLAADEPHSTTPEEATEIVARWVQDPELARQRLIDGLADRGVDPTGLTWLSSEETSTQVRHWIDQGAQRYGRFALIPPQGSKVYRGEFRDGELPPWLDTRDLSQDVFVSFSRPAAGHKRIARTRFGYVVENLVSLARADGDGFAAFTADLSGVLLINVDNDLDESTLEFDAWGTLIRNPDE